MVITHAAVVVVATHVCHGRGCRRVVLVVAHVAIVAVVVVLRVIVVWWVVVVPLWEQHRKDAVCPSCYSS